MKTTMQSELNHIKWLLVDQIVDLSAPIYLMKGYINSSTFDEKSGQSLGMFRLCNHGLIISLSKLREIVMEYGKTINTFPDHIKAPFQNLRKEIELREIHLFRNKYAAHIMDKDGKPLSLAKGEQMLNKIVGKDIVEMLKFYDWIYPEGNYKNSACVMSCVENVRDYCISQLPSDLHRP